MTLLTTEKVGEFGAQAFRLYVIVLKLILLFLLCAEKFGFNRSAVWGICAQYSHVHKGISPKTPKMTCMEFCCILERSHKEQENLFFSCCLSCAPRCSCSLCSLTYADPNVFFKDLVQRTNIVLHDQCGPWKHLLTRSGYMELVRVVMRFEWFVMILGAL